jgi:hypothetical protein
MPEDKTLRPLSTTDLSALIGVLARLAGLIMAGGIDEQQTAGFLRRAIEDGLVKVEPGIAAGTAELTQALEDLIHRLRVALAE